jgi:hypothetical protein
MADMIQVLVQAKRSVFKQKNGTDFVLHEAQCVALGEEVKVGVLKINDRVAKDVLVDGEIDGKEVKVLPAGAYELEYGLGVAWDDKEFGGVLKSIRRLPGSGNAALAALGSARPVKEVPPK